MRILLASSLIVLVGCSGLMKIQPGKYKRYPMNPYPQYRKIAVWPVMSSSSLKRTDDFGMIFATELAKFPETQVVRPADLAMEVSMLHGRATVQDVILVARKYGVDAVIALTITDYDPYTPFKMAVQVEVITPGTRKTTRKSFDLQALVMGGSWGETAVKLDPRYSGHFAWAHEVVRDTHFKKTRTKARQYAAAGSADDHPYDDPNEVVVYIQERFWEFVSNEIIREFFSLSPDFDKNEAKPQ